MAIGAKIDSIITISIPPKIPNGNNAEFAVTVDGIPNAN